MQCADTKSFSYSHSAFFFNFFATEKFHKIKLVSKYFDMQCILIVTFLPSDNIPQLKIEPANFFRFNQKVISV